MSTKVCSKCGRELDTSMFYKRKSASDGLRSSCKYCHADYKSNTKDMINMVINNLFKEPEKRTFDEIQELLESLDAWKQVYMMPERDRLVIPPGQLEFLRSISEERIRIPVRSVAYPASAEIIKLYGLDVVESRSNRNENNLLSPQ